MRRARAPSAGLGPSRGSSSCRGPGARGRASSGMRRRACRGRRPWRPGTGRGARRRRAQGAGSAEPGASGSSARRRGRPARSRAASTASASSIGLVVVRPRAVVVRDEVVADGIAGVGAQQIAHEDQVAERLAHLLARRSGACRRASTRRRRAARRWPPSDCAISDSWCGKARSPPPPWISNRLPRYVDRTSRSTRCASPGRPGAPRRRPRPARRAARAARARSRADRACPACPARCRARWRSAASRRAAACESSP